MQPRLFNRATKKTLTLAATRRCSSNRFALSRESEDEPDRTIKKMSTYLTVRYIATAQKIQCKCFSRLRYPQETPHGNHALHGPIGRRSV
jgi:hypothetical protein